MYQEQENSVSNSRFTLPHIELLSTCKANVNAADRNGETPCKANVNAADRNGETPLHYAAKRNRLEQVKLLLKKGAVIDIKNRFG
ncbi:ankyrin repeat domain-containing protein, partial [Wolbachia endosymbiont of Laodelphax striatellus]